MSRENPEIFVRMKNGQLVPENNMSGQLLSLYPNGQLYKLEARTRKGRSTDQNNLYWLTLDRICDATGVYPKSRLLHEELLIATGNYRLQVSLSGDVRKIPNSTKFNKMPHDEFCKYFDAATRVLAEHGIDVAEVMQGEPA